MAEEIIKHEQIYEDKIFDNLKSSADSALESINLLEAGLKSIAKEAGGKLSIAGDPKDLKQLDEQVKLVEKLNQAEKGINETIILKEKLRQQNKENADQVKASLSAYAKLSLEYRKAAQTAKDLGASNGILSKEYKTAAASANALNDKLKLIDAGLGNYQRNVGNYHGTIKTLASGLSGLTGLAASFGEALGINTEALIQVKDASHQLLKVSRELNHAKHLETLSTEANTVAEGENVVVTESAVVATNAETVAVEKASIAHKAWNFIMGLNPLVLLVTAIGLAVAAIYQFVTAEDEATRATREHNIELYNQIEIQKALNNITQHYQDEQRKFDRANLEGQLKYLENTGAGLDEIKAKKKEIFDFDTKSLELQNKSLVVLKANLEAQYMAESDVTKRNALQDEITKVEDQLNDVEIKQANRYADLAELNHQLTTEKKKLVDVTYGEVLTLEDLLELMVKINKQYKDQNTEVATLIENTSKLNQEYNRRKEQENKVSGLSGDVSSSGKALGKDGLDKLKAINQKKIDDAKRVDDAIFKSFEDRIKREQELNKQNLAQIDKGLDQQLQLLIAGQSNIYDAMLKEKAKALEEQKKLEKKAAKEKEAQQTAEIFLEFLKADIASGGGKNGFNAAAKALAQTILAKSIASGLSGFFEGTEDTGKGGNIDSKGGMLAVLHPHERVITAKQNALIGGMSNDDVVNAVFKYKVSDKSNGENITEAQNEILISQLQELNTTIKNKKELEVNWNRLNEIILTNKQNGYTIETTYKNSPIVKRDSPFKGGRA